MRAKLIIVERELICPVCLRPIEAGALVVADYPTRHRFCRPARGK